MILRTCIMGMLGGGFLLSFSAVADDEPAAAVSKGPLVGELAAPVIRIISGERATLADVRFFSFSCEAGNSNGSPLMFVGYRADSFDPPIAEENISPIYSIQLKRDGEWAEHPIGWCGTGMDGIELQAGVTKKFGFAVPEDLAGNAVRVGIRWSRPLLFDTAEPDAFTVAWSELFLVDKVGVAAEGGPDHAERIVCDPVPPLRSGAITHGESQRGLAAFLDADCVQFKVGEPISLSHGVISVAQAEGRDAEPVEPLKVVRPCPAVDPHNRSWISVTGPNGQKLMYRGEFVQWQAVQPDDVVVLGHGQFIGTTASELNLSFDLGKPGEYRLAWHYEAGGLHGTWAGEIVSKEVKIEIVP